VKYNDDDLKEVETPNQHKTKERSELFHYLQKAKRRKEGQH